jgi:hypothetical protein
MLLLRLQAHKFHIRQPALRLPPLIQSQPIKDLVRVDPILPCRTSHRHARLQRLLYIGGSRPCRCRGRQRRGYLRRHLGSSHEDIIGVTSRNLGRSVIEHHRSPEQNSFALLQWNLSCAFILQAQPCPTFGRPIHRRGSPHRLRPGTSPHTLRIPPHDGHPVLPSARSGFRFTLADSSFRIRARLGFSIPSLSPASEALLPLLNTAPLIRAPEGLQPG